MVTSVKVSKNGNMHKAKAVKNDEFYTQLTDIEKELGHYKDQFKGKIVYCNCDDDTWSNFYKYFSLNFDYLGLKKLITTHFSSDNTSYKLEISKDINGDGKINQFDTVKTNLTQNGDFASPECLAILDECDIVVSNPPFSLARLYLETLINSGKQFLFIGNKNAITYKEFFKNIKENKLWLGYTSPESFTQPDGDEIKQMAGLCKWFTNMETNKRKEELFLYKTYNGNESEYPKYDNYDAINVDKTKDIPCDYFGYMGVPITFLDKFCPSQFDVVGCSYDYGRPEGWDNNINMSVSINNGVNCFKRLIIKRK